MTQLELNILRQNLPPLQSTNLYEPFDHRYVLATLSGQAVYPHPLQNPLHIWVGVGGTPASWCPQVGGQVLRELKYSVWHSGTLLRYCVRAPGFPLLRKADRQWLDVLA